MFADHHMHTPLCGHALGEPEEYVEVAARRGLDRIIFTCHIPLEPDEVFGGPGIRMRPGQLPAYRAAVERARRRGEALGVEVLRGIEAEIFPDADALRRMDAVLAAEDFDFVLGSQHHQLDGYRHYLQAAGLHEDPAIIRFYFAELAEAARSGRYDSLAHPDVIQIYGTVEPFHPEDYRHEIHAFLDTCAECRQPLEVNTSGWNKGIHQVHPHPVVLSWAAERGIPFTLGSDAHAPDQIAQHFPRARDLLRSLGVEEVLTFRQRQPERIPLR